MSLALQVNGVTFAFPVPGDSNWGATVTGWASAITSGVLQKAGGSFTLTAEVDFGASFGLKAVSYKSRGSALSSAGVLRLANAESIGWRNAADNADLLLTANASNLLMFDGTALQSALSVSDTSTIDLTLAGAALSAAVIAGSITNSHVASAAAVSVSKLEQLTSSRALQTSAGGVIEASAVSSTTLGYLDATSSVQTQLNARLPLAGGTMLGSLILSGAPLADLEAATKAYVDAAVMGLVVHDSVRVATTANGTFASAFQNGATVDGITLATGDRILLKNQTAQETNGVYIVAASGAPTRATDGDTWAELQRAFFFVRSGTVNANTSWASQTPVSGTIDVTAVTFGQFGSAAAYSTDGSGIELSGTTFSLELDGTTLSKSGSGLKVADLGISNAQIASAAAITRTKLAAGTANRLVYNNGSGVISDLSAIAATRLLVSDASGLPSAHIAISAGYALVSNGSGLPAASTVTETTLGFLDATSSVQTQLNARLPLTGGTLSGGLTGTSGAFSSLTVGGDPVATESDLSHPLLATYTFSGTSEVPVTSVISGSFTVYNVEVDLRPSATNAAVGLQVSRNNGASYYTSDYSYAGTLETASGVALKWRSSGSSDIRLAQAIDGTNAVGSVHLTLRIHKGSSLIVPGISFSGKAVNSSSIGWVLGVGGQNESVGVGVIDAFKILASTGTLTGVMKVYGVY